MKDAFIYGAQREKMVINNNKIANDLLTLYAPHALRSWMMMLESMTVPLMEAT